MLLVSGDDLFREALAYLPQRAVTDNTKAAGIRIKIKFPESKVILEAHDALLFSVRKEYLDDFISVAQQEMERPINFSACSLPRRFLKIPCDVEVGENYKDLFKHKSDKIKVEPPQVLVTRPLTASEEFEVTDEDARNDMFAKRDYERTRTTRNDDDIPF